MLSHHFSSLLLCSSLLSEIIYTKIASSIFSLSFFLVENSQPGQIGLLLNGAVINCIKTLQKLVLDHLNITITIAISKQNVQFITKLHVFVELTAGSPTQDSTSRSFSSCSGRITSRYFCISMVKYSDTFRIVLFLLLQMTKM